MKIFYKIKTPDKKLMKFFNITIYAEQVFVKHKIKNYFGGLLKIEYNYQKYTKNFYFLGIKIFRERLLDKKSAIILSTLRKQDKLLENIYYNMQILYQVPFVHSYFSSYKNCNVGRDIILFAGGPSIHFYDNEIPQGALKCGVNGIIKMIDDLDYLFIEDYFVEDWILNEQIDNYKGNNCQKFYGILPYRRLKALNKNRYFTDRIKPINFENSSAKPFLLADVPCEKWAIDIEREPFGDFLGAALSALQFLVYTHPKRIYLIGHDCTSQKLAYHSDRSIDVDHSAKIKSFISFNDFVTRIYPDVEIISINPVGLRGVFNDIYTRQFVAFNNLNIENMIILEKGGIICQN